MPHHSLKSIVLAVALLGLVVPSGAALLDDRAVDDVWEENGIVVAPVDGPNGNYAEIDSNGKLSVDLSDPGVNREGETLIRRVFVIANQGNTKAVFWLTHDANESITLYENVSSGHIDKETIERRSLHGQDQARELAPGEELVVSVFVDTTERADSLGPVILETITLHARTNETTTTTTTTEAPAETPTTTTTTATTTTTTTTTTPTPTPELEENDTVEVTFIRLGNATSKPANKTTTTEPPENDTTGNETTTTEPGDEQPGEQPADEESTEPTVTVEPVDPDTIDTEPPAPDAKPQAVITNRSTGDPEPPESIESNNVGGKDLEVVVNDNETVSLSGTQSYIPHSEHIDQQRKIAAASNITVPKRYENNPATLQLRVPRTKFQDVDPENAKVGRLTEQGWQLLETSVIRSTPQYVVLEAQTPGFSTFAVFSSPNVTYTWTLPDGSTHVGEDVHTEFDTPGLYNVTLTVTDAAGRSDSTQQQILVNDKPTISIEAPENISGGDRVTLHANVTNRFGNTTIRWRLPSGDTAVGTNVTYIAPAGEHEVTATVTDEYGARNTTTAILNPAPPTKREQLRTLIGDHFRLLTWIALVLLTALAILLLRGTATTPLPATIDTRTLIARLTPWRRGPRITEFAVPQWNPDRARFEIPTLSIRDPHDDLDRIELLIRTPGGTVIARKTIELHRRNHYTVAPEIVQGIPANTIDPATDYIATVRVINTRDNQTADTQPISWLQPTPGPHTEYVPYSGPGPPGSPAD